MGHPQTGSYAIVRDYFDAVEAYGRRSIRDKEGNLIMQVSKLQDALARMADEMPEVAKWLEKETSKINYNF